MASLVREHCMTCTCHNAYYNPGCPVHGTEAQKVAKGALSAKPWPEQIKTEMAEYGSTIVKLEEDDGEGMKSYLQFLQLLKAMHRDMQRGGQNPKALALIVIDAEDRILSPMIFTDGDVKDLMPSALDTIAQGLRKRIAN